MLYDLNLASLQGCIWVNAVLLLQVWLTAHCTDVGLPAATPACGSELTGMLFVLA